MCRYAKKHEDGKTYCYAHEPGPYPISDSYDKFPYMEEMCEGKRFYRCGDFWCKAPEGKAIFSILLGSFLWLVAFPFIILKEVTNPLLWNFVSLIGIVLTIWSYLENKQISKKIKSMQSKEKERA